VASRSPGLQRESALRDIASIGSNPTEPLHRLQFVEGWRKEFGAEATHNAIAVDATQRERVEIWIARTEALLTEHRALKVLNSEDWSVLDRIRSPSSRASATAARILLRHSLSHSVDQTICPQEWRFDTTTDGRPQIASGLHRRNFSVSHTEAIVAVAASKTLSVGLDVESLDQTVDDRVVSTFSFPRERDTLRTLAPQQQTREFLKLWTLKEAYTKMLGSGLSNDLSKIEFLLDPPRLGQSGGNTVKTRFETLFLCSEHTLHHVSIAIGFPNSPAWMGELRIFGLAEESGAERISSVPSISI
jgi:4'-phosphopantetheinyl transferase